MTMNRMTRNWTAAGVAGALLVVVTLLAIGTVGGGGPQQPRATHDLRTLVVSARQAEPAPSRPGRNLHALLVSGPLPRATTTAIVLADEDCAPDAAGVSNCLNRLRLADGRLLNVRHPHRMAEVPCLSPGERVNLRRA